MRERVYLHNMVHINNEQATVTYAILDAARIFGELDTAKKLQNNFLSLYKPDHGELLSTVAPYLFHYLPNAEFGKWFSDKGWGMSWGLFISSGATVEELNKHFRKFLMVKTEQKKELYFRFYDPRLLRMFLPTCDAQQLKDFFGPISKFSMESHDANYAIEFELVNNKLETKNIRRKDFWNELNQPSDQNEPQLQQPIPKGKREQMLKIIQDATPTWNVLNKTTAKTQPEQTHDQIITTENILNISTRKQGSTPDLINLMHTNEKIMTDSIDEQVKLEIESKDVKETVSQNNQESPPKWRFLIID